MDSGSTHVARSRSQADNPVAQEVLAGLRAESKRIAPKYFYDSRGSQLFDEITGLDEYYVTRTERRIFAEHREAMCDAVGPGAAVIEPGAGSCEKIRWLLPDLDPAVYVPMDISAEHLRASAAALVDDYPQLDVQPRVCDHTRGISIDDDLAGAPVFFYPGSSIGNFEPAAAVEFMRAMRARMSATGGLLIGVDTKKDVDVLQAAYDDSQGVTAEFNINVLEHLNTLLEGDLNTAHFEHVALYDETHGRIEMHLECTRDHRATVAGETLEFAAGERIHTENSYKYRPDEFAALAGQADFAARNVWQDERKWFSVLYLEPA